MGYVTFIYRNKELVDHTDVHDSYRDAESEAFDITKSLVRGTPYKLITKDVDTGEQVGKTRRIQGERFNSAISGFEEAVNVFEGYKTTREGREYITNAEYGLDSVEDPRWSSKTKKD